MPPCSSWGSPASCVGTDSWGWSKTSPPGLSSLLGFLHWREIQSWPPSGALSCNSAFCLFCGKSEVGSNRFAGTSILPRLVLRLGETHYQALNTWISLWGMPHNTCSWHRHHNYWYFEYFPLPKWSKGYRFVASGSSLGPEPGSGHLGLATRHPRRRWSSSLH